MAKSMGASLYVPANHKYLMAVADGERIAHARSLIFCTEDAVADRDLSWALFNLSPTAAPSASCGCVMPKCWRACWPCRWWTS